VIQHPSGEPHLAHEPLALSLPAEIPVGAVQDIFQLLTTGTLKHRAQTPSPLPLRVAKTDENHLNAEITALLPTDLAKPHQI
jgi:hypothetical protein